MQVKVGDEADELKKKKKIESETNSARRVLTSVYFSRNTSPVSTHVYSVSSLNSNTKLTNRNGESGVGNLETVRIPTFSDSKTEFQDWNATFTSCIDAICNCVVCLVQNVKTGGMFVR